MEGSDRRSWANRTSLAEVEPRLPRASSAEKRTVFMLIIPCEDRLLLDGKDSFVVFILYLLR